MMVVGRATKRKNQGRKVKGVLSKLGNIVSAIGARPLSVGLLLTIVFWICLGNFVVAAFAGLLVSFFISAAVSAWKLNRRSRGPKPGVQDE